MFEYNMLSNQWTETNTPMNQKRRGHECVKINEASQHKRQRLVVEALVVIQQLNTYILDRTNVKLSEVQIRKRT